MSRDESPVRKVKKLDDIFVLGCIDSDQRKLLYLALVLECDTPIIEAVFHCALVRCMLPRSNRNDFVHAYMRWLMPKVELLAETCIDLTPCGRYQLKIWRNECTILIDINQSKPIVLVEWREKTEHYVFTLVEMLPVFEMEVNRHVSSN